MPGQFGSSGARAAAAGGDDMMGVNIGIDDVGLIDAEALEMLLAGGD